MREPVVIERLVDAAATEPEPEPLLRLYDFALALAPEPGLPELALADLLAALRALYERSQSQPYAGWCDVVPTFSDPFRAPQPDEMEVVAEQASSKA